ncbi:hypothetical protein ABFY57_12015 [Paenibacillus polymyxa]|uniref:hypothetical protein n=1 Tax=Paenibacillus polymyxa TaxID=1406 RepID=UPI002019D22A|nr:hypothetical protein [Paenibacillus polymyxa]UQQ36173.1 hypothetical protein LMH85_04440 [Paenibacillus polymyxa]
MPSTFVNPAYIAAAEVKRILSSDTYQLKPHSHKYLDQAWYLIPPQHKTKKQGPPFYHLGKFTFSWKTVDGQTFLNVGVHVEKGSASSTPTGDRWFWHTFMRRVKEGTFESDLLNLSKALGDKLVIQIDGHHGEKPNRISDTLLYHWQNGQCIRLKTEDKRELQVFREVPDEDAGISKIIEAVSHDQWAWIDVYIEFEISLIQGEAVEEQVNEIWYKGLHQLQKYASE